MKHKIAAYIYAMMFVTAYFCIWFTDLIYKHFKIDLYTAKVKIWWNLES